MASLQLKPLTIDSNSRQLDSKQKKFNANIQRALEHFDSVTEWADYIASLGKLLKALQSWSPQFQNVRYYVPSPYQVSRRLTSSLSPNLPAGVHQKTLEVYTFIFERIGQDTLAAECNIWVPGILPLMTYASMSVKSHLIELYDNYLIELPSSTLKLLIRPLLASLLPGIDDESSEFQPLVMKLIENLKENLAEDSLFWQTCFLVMITSKERRLGGLVWLTKKFPSLNPVPHLVLQKNRKGQDNQTSDGKEDNIKSDLKEIREEAFSVLLPSAKALLSPEPGLLIRCMVCCLAHDNDLIIKRGIWDLLLQRFHLNSPVLDCLVSASDKKMLTISCCKTTLEKDMSLNRRVWNWLLGPAFSSTGNSTNSTAGAIPDKDQDKTLTVKSNEYFSQHGAKAIVDGLKDMVKVEATIITVFSICLSVMDRWEIGSLIIPEMFIPLMQAAQTFKQNAQVMKTANTFFDTVETNIIWGKIYQHVTQTEDLEFLDFILSYFNIASDEEIIIRHLPLVLLALLCHESETKEGSTDLKESIYEVCMNLLSNIPERAFLPLAASSQLNHDGALPKSIDILKNITDFYIRVSDSVVLQDMENLNDVSPPFDHQELTILTVNQAHELLLDSLKNDELVIEAAQIFISIYERVPAHSTDEEDESLVSDGLNNRRLVDAIFMRSKKAAEKHSDSVYGIAEIFSKYLSSRISLLEINKLLKLVLSALWKCLVTPSRQLSAVKCLLSLEKSLEPAYVEGALSYAFLQENDISKSIIVLDLLWNHLEPRSIVLRRPLELMIDELFLEENPHYLSVSKWVLSVLNAGSANRLFYFLTHKLLEFDFLNRSELQDLDDLDNFTYRIQALTSVLKTNNRVVIKLFSSELSSIDSLTIWQDEDISTYKNLVLAILLRFLEMKNNHSAKSIRSSLILLECLLNGTERNFKKIVITLLEMSSQYISQGGLDSELITVALLNIVSKVLRLSHENGIKLDIFDDSGTHLKYVDYLVTSVSNIESPLIVTSYMKLLSESLIYFESFMFRIILLLSASIVGCIKKLFEKEKRIGGYYQSISLLLGGLEEILEVSHSFLLTEEKEQYFSGSSYKGDFIQSMVSNVFSSDSSTNDVKIKGERDVILQSFRQVVNCCFEIWTWAHGLYVADKKNSINQMNYNSYKFKFAAKKLLEKLFTLEPIEVIEDLVLTSSEETTTLIHVLDGNRPALSIPYLFVGIMHRQNRNTSVKLSISVNSFFTTGNRLESSLINKLDSEALVRFLIVFASSLENAAIEDFYSDFFTFFKEVSTNYNLYESISKPILVFVVTMAQKLSKSNFGQQKRIRRELSDLFTKYLPNALNDSPFNYVDAPQTFSDLESIVENLQYVLNDEIGGDRFNNCMSTIVNQCAAPYIKNRTAEIPDFVLKFSLEVAKTSGKVKSWRSMINDYFFDDKSFASLANNKLWRQIIFEWSQYPDKKSSLINDLLSIIDSKTTSMAPNLITFTAWSESENESKCQSFLRISYLLMILPKNYYLLHFHDLVSCVCQYLSSENTKLKEKCWILLKAMLLKFNVLHFNDYWSMIVYCLQTNLQAFYESLQIQAEIDSAHILQVCKTLDLLLALNFEGFSGTNEWLFVIDTINNIYKTYPFMALVDKIYECKEFQIDRRDSTELIDRTKLKIPLLVGINSVKNHVQLRTFFQNLSYAHYEYIYSLGEIDLQICEDDICSDIFA